MRVFDGLLPYVISSLTSQEEKEGADMQERVNFALGLVLQYTDNFNHTLLQYYESDKSRSPLTTLNSKRSLETVYRMI